jgi:type IV secretion system protein VirB8
MKKRYKMDDKSKYFEDSQNWEVSKARLLMNSERKAWRVVAVLSVITISAVCAVALLTPLKRTEPFVIRVDNSTGIVDLVETITDGKTNYSEEINKYFLNQFVRFREGYSNELKEEYYRNVGYMSNHEEQQRFFEYFNPQNPLSPLNVYGDRGKITTTVKSISFIKPNVALVRFVKEVHESREVKKSHWAATITFEYVNGAIADSVRVVNPLGFQVTDYRVDADAIEEISIKGGK